MSSIGSGYDNSSTVFSPDGRLFQVEYASKAVDNSSTIVGVVCKDGVVLGVEKLIMSKMLVEGSNRRLQAVDKHAGLAAAGLVADARQLVYRAREEANNYRTTYGIPVDGRTLTDRLAAFMHAYTLYSGVRPFGCSAIVAAYDADGPQLFMIEPSGVYYGYHGISIGKAKQAAKTEIEKLKLGELTCREAIFEVAKTIHRLHDTVKDKDFELEMAWICDESKKQFQLVPEAIKNEAEQRAKAALEAEEAEA